MRRGRKRGEAPGRLGEPERLLAALLRASPVATAILSLPEGRILDVSASFTELLGYGRDEVVGRLERELDLWVHAGSRRHAEELLREQGHLRNLPFSFRRKSGEAGEGVLYATLVESSEGRFLVAEVLDVTERSRAHAALERLEGRLADAEGLAGFGSVRYDVRQGRFFLSAGALRMLGISPELFRGTAAELRARLHPADRGRFARAVRSAVAGDRGAEGEYQIVTAAGVVRRLAGRMRLDRTEDGERVRYEAMIHDVTAQRAAEAALERAVGHLRLLRAIDQESLASRGPEEIAVRALRGLRKLVSFSFGAVYLGEEGGSPRLLASVAREGVAAPPSAELRKLAEIAYGARRPVFLDGDGGSDPPARSAVRLLAMALRLHGASAGLLFLRFAAASLTPEGVAVVEDVGGRLAATIREATLRAEGDRSGRETVELARRLSTFREDERKHLSRELHDRLGQAVTALGLGIATIREAVRPAERSSLDEWFQGAFGQVESVGRAVRDLMTELRPPSLAEGGLLGALRWCAGRAAGEGGITARVGGEEPLPRLPQEVELAFFRIAQEAISNVRVHAPHSHVEITLGGEVEARLEIHDDGPGFDIAARTAASATAEGRAGGHWGLAIMRERALAVGAELAVESAPGKGTTVRATYRVVAKAH